jgi:predicted DsbA family dithiol-disulfide isomerase
VAAGRRHAVQKELGAKATFERRTFLLLPGWEQRPTYDTYVISHRLAAKRAAPELPFAIPDVGHPYPKSSLPAQLVAMHVQKTVPGKLDVLEDGLYRAVFATLEDVADPAVLRRVAEKAGVAAREVDLALADPELKRQAMAEHIEAEEHGINGIPALLVPGHAPIVGAVPLDVYKDALSIPRAPTPGKPPRRLPRSSS